MKKLFAASLVILTVACSTARAMDGEDKKKLIELQEKGDIYLANPDLKFPGIFQGREKFTRKTWNFDKNIAEKILKNSLKIEDLKKGTLPDDKYPKLVTSIVNLAVEQEPMGLFNEILNNKTQEEEELCDTLFGNDNSLIKFGKDRSQFCFLIHKISAEQLATIKNLKPDDTFIENKEKTAREIFAKKQAAHFINALLDTTKKFVLDPEFTQQSLNLIFNPPTTKEETIKAAQFTTKSFLDNLETQVEKEMNNQKKEKSKKYQ